MYFVFQQRKVLLVGVIGLDANFKRSLDDLGCISKLQENKFISDSSPMNPLVRSGSFSRV